MYKFWGHDYKSKGLHVRFLEAKDHRKGTPYCIFMYMCTNNLLEHSIESGRPNLGRGVLLIQ